MKVRMMTMVIMIITDSRDSAGVSILHRYNECGNDQHLFFPTCRQAVTL